MLQFPNLSSTLHYFDRFLVFELAHLSSWKAQMSITIIMPFQWEKNEKYILRKSHFHQIQPIQSIIIVGSWGSDQTFKPQNTVGCVVPQVRTPQVWPPVMSWSRTVDDWVLSSFWWPPDKEMLSGVPLIGDPDASRINLTLSVFYFSLSFFLFLSNLWPRPQGIYSRNYKLFISLDLPDEGFTINRKLAGRCQLLIHTKSIPWCNFSSL